MLQFKADEHQSKVLQMCDILKDKILDEKIVMSSTLFENLVSQYTESQSWNKLLNLINRCDYNNCEPSPRTVSFVKKNLVYCFDTTVRSQLKDCIESFEVKFFSTTGREARREVK